VPSTAVAGDYATVLIHADSITATMTTPSGWTLTGGPIRGSSSSTWRVAKTVVSGDIGATVNLVFSSAQRCQALMMVASGVDVSSAAAWIRTETSNTSSPTMPSVPTPASGSMVFGVLQRRFTTTPAGTLHLPSKFTELTSPVSTGYGSSPELEIVGGYWISDGSSVSSLTGTSSPSSTGACITVSMPATTAGGSSATVALTTATATASANPLTVVGGGAVSGVPAASVYDQAIRSGGIDVTYSVSASLGGVPVQGAQDLRPTGGTITDTTKPGARWQMRLELAPEVLDGRSVYDLLTPSGTTLTVMANVRYLDESTLQIPMGVYDVDSESVSEGGGAVSVTAPDKWVRVQRARFLVPQSSTPGIPVTQQIVQLIQGALGGDEQVVISATSTATVGALTWDRDRDKAIIDLATSIGAWVFFDRNGVATIADIPQIGAAADWLIDASANGVLVSLDRQRSREGTYNVVVVSSSASTAEAFDPVYVWDGDSSSPTYAGTDPLLNPGSAGEFGIVPFFYSSPVLSSAGEAGAAGLSILSRTVGQASSVSLSDVPNPKLEAFHVIDVLPPTIPYGPTRELERHVVDTVTHPLTVDGGPQQIDARSTRTDYTGDVSG
jgi:hypothetical protein